MTKIKMMMINMIIIGTILLKGASFDNYNHYQVADNGKVIHYEVLNNKEDRKIYVYQNDNLVLTKNYWK